MFWADILQIPAVWADMGWSTDRPSGAKQDALFIQRGAWKYVDENIYILG